MDGIKMHHHMLQTEISIKIWRQKCDLNHIKQKIWRVTFSTMCFDAPPTAAIKTTKGTKDWFFLGNCRKKATNEIQKYSSSESRRSINHKFRNRSRIVVNKVQRILDPTKKESTKKGQLERSSWNNFSNVGAMWLGAVEWGRKWTMACIIYTNDLGIEQRNQNTRTGGKWNAES